MLLLKKTPLKLSHISTELDFTVQETSRNVARLADASLVKKDTEGLFHLTSYGEETLNLLSGFRFLYKNREYFTTHTLAALPPQFRNSVGILEPCQYVEDVMLTFHNIELMVAAAEKHVWIVTDQILASTLPFLEKAFERRVQFHLILPKKYAPPQSMLKMVVNPTFRKAVQTGVIDVRSTEKIDAFLCVSDRELSALAFTNIQGKLEYSAFKSEGISVVEWCNSLFMHYWNAASPQVPELINQGF